MVELADTMVMERTTLVRALKPLQRDGLVLSEPSEHDGRTYQFNLSKAGKETFEQAAIAWRAAQDEFESKFGRSRAKALRAELVEQLDQLDFRFHNVGTALAEMAQRAERTIRRLAQEPHA